MTMRTPLLLPLTICSTTALAQVPLPYSTGFDNSAQQAGWVEFRKGTLSNYSWDISAGQSVSAPYALWHDYPVGGNATDTVQDWFVSPPFDLSQGGSVSLSVQVYSIIGSTTPADQLKVFLLTGSNDPAVATSITELADLTGLVASTDDFNSVGPFNIPPVNGNAHIAFFYRATNNWFTIRVDDVSVTSEPFAVEEHTTGSDPLELFPNPTTGLLNVRTNAQEMNAAVHITDAEGKTDKVMRSQQGMVDVSALPAGRYLLRINEGERTRRASFIKH